MKTIKNRVSNAIVLSFIATLGWFILGLIVDGGGLEFAIRFGIGMFIPLFILMIILVFCEEDLDLFQRKDSKIKLKEE